jgi:hypothetical protein
VLPCFLSQSLSTPFSASFLILTFPLFSRFRLASGVLLCSPSCPQEEDRLETRQPMTGGFQNQKERTEKDAPSFSKRRAFFSKKDGKGFKINGGEEALLFLKI